MTQAPSVPAVAARDNDELELVLQARAGRRASLEALFAKYHLRIEIFVRNFFHARGECEDVTQEVFVQAYLHFGELRDPAKFRSWLYRIAWRACLHESRKRKMDMEKLMQASQEAALSREASEPVSLTESSVPELMARLSPVDRLIVWLRYVDDVPYPEIAPLLDLSEQAVRQRSCRALGLLREVLS